MTARRAGRRAAPRPGGRSPRTVLIGLACVLALGAAFAAGVVSARQGWGSSETKSGGLAGWKWKSWIGIAPRKSAAEAAGDRTRAERPARPVPPAPVLTFYHELTAPLAPVPPPPKARPPAAERPASVPASTPAPPPPPAPLTIAVPPQGGRRDPSPPPPGEAGVTAPAAAPASTPPRQSQAVGARFTIQVGAYRARAAADALQAKLGGSGHEVYVVEDAASEGLRYRVRVGSFLTQDAARTAAAKLADEQHVPIYVTPR